MCCCVQKRNKILGCTMMSQNGGSFYASAQSEVLIDPFVSPPQMQNQLIGELTRCEDLVRRDFRYAHLVAGASKMPMNMIWVARNQGGDVNDRDLSMLRDVAWNEFVMKRFLPAVVEGTPVADAAASMLEIVRSMNLQRRRFQIMGLHEQVEASELQFVIHLCQAGLLHTADYRITANRFRRHDKLFEAFALAVGAFVCSSAPFTMGVATTQLNRSLQFEYKKQTIALFVYVLQENRGVLGQISGLDEDYVARIARFIIVSQDNTGVAGHREEKECKEARDEGFIRSAVESMQRQADRLTAQVERNLDRIKDNARGGGGVTAAEVRALVNTLIPAQRPEPAAGVTPRVLDDMVAAAMRRRNEQNDRLIEGFREQNERLNHDSQARILSMEQSAQKTISDMAALRAVIAADLTQHHRAIRDEMIRLIENEFKSEDTEIEEFKKVMQDLWRSEKARVHAEVTTFKHEMRNEISALQLVLPQPMVVGGPQPDVNAVQTLVWQEMQRNSSAFLTFITENVQAMVDVTSDRIITEKIPFFQQVRDFVPTAAAEFTKHTADIVRIDAAILNLTRGMTRLETNFGNLSLFAKQSDLADSERKMDTYIQKLLETEREDVAEQLKAMDELTDQVQQNLNTLEDKIKVVESTQVPPDLQGMIDAALIVRGKVPTTEEYKAMISDELKKIGWFDLLTNKIKNMETDMKSYFNGQLLEFQTAAFKALMDDRQTKKDFISGIVTDVNFSGLVDGIVQSTSATRTAQVDQLLAALQTRIGEIEGRLTPQAGPQQPTDLEQRLTKLEKDFGERTVPRFDRFRENTDTATGQYTAAPLPP